VIKKHVSTDDLERWEERAAIQEFDAGKSRAGAEWSAARAARLPLDDLRAAAARRRERPIVDPEPA
jgi:hypothetical protein